MVKIQNIKISLIRGQLEKHRGYEFGYSLEKKYLNYGDKVWS